METIHDTHYTTSKLHFQTKVDIGVSFTDVSKNAKLVAA